MSFSATGLRAVSTDVVITSAITPASLAPTNAVTSCDSIRAMSRSLTTVSAAFRSIYFTNIGLSGKGATSPRARVPLQHITFPHVSHHAAVTHSPLHVSASEASAAISISLVYRQTSSRAVLLKATAHLQLSVGTVGTVAQSGRRKALYVDSSPNLGGAKSLILVSKMARRVIFRRKHHPPR